VPNGHPPRGPKVRLGRTSANGVAPSFYGLVERGIERRPDVARRMRGRVVLRFHEEIDPLRVTFRAKTVVVEDGDLRKPDLAIAGRMPDIVHFATAPHWRGVPNPVARRGRAALGHVASRRVKLTGDANLARRLVRLLAV
jgi:hypothetical protein